MAAETHNHPIITLLDYENYGKGIDTYRIQQDGRPKMMGRPSDIYRSYTSKCK